MRLIRLPQKHLSPTLARVAMPAFAKQQHNLPALKSGLIKIQSALAYATLPILVGAFLTREHLVPILYGRERMDLVPVVEILVWPALFQALTGSMGAVHLALGRVRFLFVWSAFALVVWGSGMYLAAQRSFELLLITRLLCGVGMSVFFAWLTFRIIGASLRDSARSISRPAACTALMSACVSLVSLISDAQPTAIALTVQVITGVISVAAAAWLLDRAFVQEMGGLLLKSRRT